MQAVSRWPEPLARAYGVCETLARSHYENFPVASWLVPAALGPHIAAVYAFARVADDIADEGAAPPDLRRSRLRTWHQRLHDAVANGADGRAALSRDDLIIVALSHSVRSLGLPISAFDDLLSAFGQDTMTNRYSSWSEVLDYCRRSANPIGRLVLRTAGIRVEAIDRLSDALCTALQLTNFWQDFGEDWRRGRLYVPRDVQDSCGAVESDLAQGAMTAAWADAIEACCRRTRVLFDQGRAVCDRVRGRLRYELRVTWVGGLEVLKRVETEKMHLLVSRPSLRSRDVPAVLWQAVRWRGAA
jgi:squalene synthase HpnC